MSVAQAHVGAAVRSLPSTEIVVLSSDPTHMAIVCTPAAVRIVVI